MTPEATGIIDASALLSETPVAPGAAAAGELMPGVRGFSDDRHLNRKTGGRYSPLQKSGEAARNICATLR